MPLFAHPLTFLVTHVLFPLLSAGAISYLYWLSYDGLAAPLALQAKLLLAAAWAFPTAAFGLLAFRPRRIPVWLSFGSALLGTAFLYWCGVLLGDMTRGVDDWVCGPTPGLSLCIGIMPLIFAGIASLATADWHIRRKWLDVSLSAACVFLPPALVYLWVCVFSVFCRRSATMDWLAHLPYHIYATLFILSTIALFVGLLRIVHQIHAAVSKNRLMGFAMTVVYGLILPLAGLGLNLAMPFPADFKNAWAWGLAVLTGVVLLLPVTPNRRGLVAYALRFAVAPFVLYFFLLFIPFLPLAIPAILMAGLGFLILAPTLLFRCWSMHVHAAYRTLRTAYSRRTLIVLGLAGFLVMPVGFIAHTEIERHDLAAIIDWHVHETFDELEPPPPPMSMERARAIMNGVNIHTFGSEIPFLSAWRDFRVYGGMYMSDKLRNALNRRILGRQIDDARDLDARARDMFGPDFAIFGGRASARRDRQFGFRATRRPPRTTRYSATAASIGTNGQDRVYEVLVSCEHHDQSASAQELVLDFRVPAGTWVEGLALKMADGKWKVGRPSERKAAEWVYRKITDQRLDPSLLTLDSPTTGRLRVFPVESEGREVKVRLRRSANLSTAANDELIAFAAVPEPPVARRVLNPKTHRRELVRTPRAPNLPWQVVRLPPVERETSPIPPRGGIVRCTEAGVSLVSPECFRPDGKSFVPSTIAAGQPIEFAADDPVLMSKLRRRLRFAAREMANGSLGVLPDIRLLAAKGDTNAVDGCRAPADVLTEGELAILRRELPGMAAFGDRPVDGWRLLPTVEGGQVAVPFRKGEGTLVFAALRDGVESTDAAWNAGALAWNADHRSFLRPGEDRRRELLAAMRSCGVLTTQTAYIVVERTAQEKGLRQKEAEALRADKALDFDEPATDADAPGFWLLLGLLLIIGIVRGVIFTPGVRN